MSSSCAAEQPELKGPRSEIKFWQELKGPRSEIEF